MKRHFAIVIAVLSWLLPNPANSAAHEKLQQPLAVLISADWCYNCKQIKPKLAEVRKVFDGKVDFMSLDVTDDARFAKARTQADALGIGYLLQGQFATGWVALIDRDGRKVGELYQQMSVEDMQKALRSLAAAPR